MVSLQCHTNLDLCYEEKWPESLPVLPCVGDLIESGYEHRGGFRLRLKVVRVVWKHDDNMWKPHVELHDFMNRSLDEFSEWYYSQIGGR